MSTNDQMSLLHETWSELVLLDHIYRQVWFSNQENILLVSGESVSSKFYLPTPAQNKKKTLDAKSIPNDRIFGPKDAGPT